MRAQQADASPVFHCVRCDAQPGGGFGERQQAAFAQPVISRLEMIMVPDAATIIGFTAVPIPERKPFSVSMRAICTSV